MKITTPTGTLDLSSDFSIQIEESSPVMNDRGSQSVPVTVPATALNSVATGWPQRIDLATQLLPAGAKCTVHDGAYIRQGTINVISAGAAEGITMNIGFDNSEAYSQWAGTRLSDLECPVKDFGAAESLATHMRDVYNAGLATDAPYAVFPVCVSCPTVTVDGQEVAYPQYLNRVEGGLSPSLIVAARQETVVIDGEPVPTQLPAAYGLTPFLYVRTVLDIIFKCYGYKLLSNPFESDVELRRVVVLNNTADACVTGTLSYSELMPDCTVEDFLQALYVRFGLVYNISTDKRTVSLRLLRDIVADHDSQTALFATLSSRPFITYESAKQVRLSASTSLDLAAAPAARWEDFAQGREQQVVSVARVSDDVARNASLVRELATGDWYQYDSANLAAVRAGTSHFAWDRQTPNVETQDLTSPDECVPMQMELIADGVYTPVPQFRKDPRHRHTFVRMSDSDSVSEDQGETPLSFLLALPTTYGYAGPLTGTVVPYDSTGKRIQLAHAGGAHLRNVDFSFSLLFQFADGLFAQFWASYDAVLRHANHQVELDVRANVHDMVAFDMLTPCLVHGQRLLPDRLSYSLPKAGRMLPVHCTLRSLELIGPYDLIAEQGIQVMDDSGQILYMLSSTTLDAVVTAARLRARDYAEQQAIQRLDARTIQSFRFDMYYYAVTSEQVSYNGYTRPEDDAEVRAMRPVAEGIVLTKQYQAAYTCVVQWDAMVTYGIHFQPLSGTETYNEVIAYQATFNSRQV